MWLTEMPILKLGLTYPLNAELVTTFAAQVKNIIVIEERRGFMEEQIAAILTEHAQRDAVFQRPASGENGSRMAMARRRFAASILPLFSRRSPRCCWS